MKSSELRELSVEDLGKKVTEQREEIEKLNMQRLTRRLDKTSDYQDAKRNLARALTILGEKQREAAQKEGA